MSQFLNPCPIGTTENINGDCVRQQYLRPFFEYGGKYGNEDVVKQRCTKQMGRDCEKCGNVANAKIYPKCETGYKSPGENMPYTECEYCAPPTNSAQVVIPRSERLSNLVSQDEFKTLNTRFADFNSNFDKRVTDIYSPDLNKRFADFEKKVVYLPDYNKTAEKVQSLQQEINSMTANLNTLLGMDINGTLQRLTNNISQYKNEAKLSIDKKGEQIDNLSRLLEQVRGDHSKTSELVSTINIKIKEHEDLINRFVADREREIKLIDEKLSTYLNQNQVNALIADKISAIESVYASKQALDQALSNISSTYLSQKQFQTALDNAKRF